MSLRVVLCPDNASGMNHEDDSILLSPPLHANMLHACMNSREKMYVTVSNGDLRVIGSMSGSTAEPHLETMVSIMRRKAASQGIPDHHFIVVAPWMLRVLKCEPYDIVDLGSALISDLPRATHVKFLIPAGTMQLVMNSLSFHLEEKLSKCSGVSVGQEVHIVPGKPPAVVTAVNPESPAAVLPGGELTFDYDVDGDLELPTITHVPSEVLSLSRSKVTPCYLSVSDPRKEFAKGVYRLHVPGADACGRAPCVRLYGDVQEGVFGSATSDVASPLNWTVGMGFFGCTAFMIELAAGVQSVFVMASGPWAAELADPGVAASIPDRCTICELCGCCVSEMSSIMHSIKCASSTAVCDHPGCGVRVAREYKDAHRLAMHSEYGCPTCWKSVWCGDYEVHTSAECPNRTVTCPFCMRTDIPASVIEEHNVECDSRHSNPYPSAAPLPPPPPPPTPADHGIDAAMYYCPRCANSFVEPEDLISHMESGDCNVVDLVDEEDGV